MVHANDISMQVAGSRCGSDVSVWPVPSASAGSAAVRRRRLRLGSITVDIRRFAKLQPTQITLRPSAVVLIVSFRGCCRLVNEGFHGTADKTQALLLARSGTSTLVWTPESEGLLVHLPRQRMQALASRELDLPVRFCTSEAVVPLAKDSRLSALLAELIGEADHWTVFSEHRERSWAERLEAALTSLWASSPARDDILTVSRSVRRAMEHVRENAEADLDAAALAALSGVTVRTLREGFRSCLGVSLATFVQDARLAWARDRLASGHDSRSMSEIAQAAGFGSPSSFSRAYARAFGETPSQTRARSVREAEI